MTDSIIITTIFLVYIAGLAYIVFSNKKADNFQDFAVGGRSFSWPFITMTIIGTSYAGSLMTGYTQFGHDIGMTVTYYTTSTILGLFFFAIICGPLWKIGNKYDVKTMGEYLEFRYGSKALRVFIGISLLLVELPWIVTELLASGYAIQILTNNAIPFNLGMAIIAVFFIVYILFSGMRAVIFADYYQGWIFVLAGSALFIIAMVTHFGGYGEMWEMTRDLKAELLTIPGSVEGWWGEVPGRWFFPSLILMGAFGAYMWPSLFARIFAAKSTKELKISLQITPLIVILFSVTCFFIAIGTSTLPQYGAEDSAQAFIEFISSMGPVPTALIAIIILAGSLSMMDSMLSSWATVFTNDVITPFKPGISTKAQVKIARVFTIIIGGIGLLIAMTELPTIVQILTRVYQVIVQAFPVVVLGLFWKRGNKVAAWGGTLIGFVVVIFFSFTQPDYIPMFNGMQGGLVALAINFIVYIILSLVIKSDQNLNNDLIILGKAEEYQQRVSSVQAEGTTV